MKELAIGLPEAKYLNLGESSEDRAKKVVKKLDSLLSKITICCHSLRKLELRKARVKEGSKSDANS